MATRSDLCNCATFEGPPQSYQELERRCASAGEIQKTLQKIKHHNQTWMSVWRCSVCLRYWGGEYPYSERHGGGPLCLYPIVCDDPIAWLDGATPFCDELVRRHEDSVYCESLGPEAGPESCNEPGCRNLRIRQSSKCRRHHFEMMERLWKRTGRR